MVRWITWATLGVVLICLACQATAEEDKIDDIIANEVDIANNKIERSNLADLDTIVDLERFDRQFVTPFRLWRFWPWRRRWWTLWVRVVIPWWRRWWFWRFWGWRVINLHIRIRHFWWWCDPHYSQFDGNTYEFHGTCTYTLSKTCDSSGVVPFTVSVENFYATESQEANKVSSPKKVIFEIFGYTLSVDQGKIVRINGVVTNQNEILNDPSGSGFVTISRDGDNVVMCTHNGIVVTFNGRNRMTLNVPEAYFGKLCGMAGNFDDDPSNDFEMPNGISTTDMDEFGNSWKDDRFSNPACVPGGGATPNCAPGELAGVEEMCNKFHHAAFSACHPHVPPEDFEQECVYDMCADPGNTDLLCTHYSMYADECEMGYGVDVDWRSIVPDCVVDCGAYAHFEENVESCMIRTCEIPDADDFCEAPTDDTLSSDGCVCDDGYLMEDGNCVAPNMCGCIDDKGDYYKIGESWTDCGVTCYCVAHDEINCNCHALSPPCGPDDTTALCSCSHSMCPRTCTVTSTGLLTHLGASSQLPNNFKSLVAETNGGDTDPCKVKIQIRMDQNKVTFAGINLGVWEGKPTKFAKNYVFNLWGNIGVSERGKGVKGVFYHPVAPPPWTDGHVGVTITQIQSHAPLWKLVATCDGGTMLTLFYGYGGGPLFDLDVTFSDMFDGLCYPEEPI